jgi:hypothetical protein
MQRRLFIGLAVAVAGWFGLRRAHAALSGAAPARWNGLLPAGRFMAAKMPLTPERVVLPRPDSETSTRAYHRNAHVGLPFELPIVVQGGSWPFVYELLDAPAGASLGRNHGDANYGILRWTPSANGAFSFTVRVRDQDGGSVQFSWSGVVSSSWARFVDAINGSDTTGNGSLSAPWRSLAYAYAQLQDGGGLCLRAGQYQSPAEAMNIAVSGGSGAGRIGSLFGWPGESARVDCSTHQSGELAWYNSSDTFIGQIAFVGGPSGQANPRFFASLNVNHRCYQYRLEFDSPTLGTTSGGGDDNNSCLFLGAGGSVRNYVAQVFCTFRRLPFTNNGFSAIDTYQTRYLVVADNVFDAPAAETAQHAIWIKGWEQEDVTIRSNRWTQGWDGGLIELAMSAAAGSFTTRRLEVCYNTLVTRNGGGGLSIGVAPTGGARGPIWIYRNTLSAIAAIHWRDWPLSISFENDVIVHDANVPGGNTSAGVVLFDPNAALGVYRDPAVRGNLTLVLDGTECHGGSSDGILDAQYRLQGAWRSQYLGLRGAEIVAPDRMFDDGFEGSAGGA